MMARMHASTNEKSAVRSDPRINQLAQLYANGRYFEFLQQSHRALAEPQVSPSLTEVTLDGLVRLGLGGCARELIQSPQASRLDGARASGLVESLQALPDGRLTWERLAATWRRNIQTLATRDADLAARIEQAASRLQHVHLHRTARGALYLSQPAKGSVRRWLLPVTIEPAEEKIELPPRGKLGPVAFVGLRVGTLLRRIVEDTCNLFLTLSHPVYLIEPDARRLVAWLHVADQTALLSQPRVLLFFGEDAVDHFRRALADDDTLPSPQLVINQSQDVAATGRLREQVIEVESDRQGELQRLQDALARRYQDRDMTYWARRWERPGVILGVTSRFTTVLQYVMRDALTSAEGLGWQTEMFIEADDYHRFSPIELLRRIHDLDPDLLVLLDHLRYEQPFLPRNLPMLSWIQDPLPNLLNAQAGASLGPMDFVCGYYKARCVSEFGYPENQFHSCVLPVSERLFHDGDIDAETARKLDCDMSFVSNASQPIEQYISSAAQRYPAQWQPLLTDIYQRVQRVLANGEHLDFDIGAARLVREAAEQANLALDDAQVERLKTDIAYRLFDWGRRQQTLSWAGDWAQRADRRLRIYGRGWEQHPTLSPYAAGVVEHGEPLRKAIRASRLALQLIPSGFRHQRSFELLACGTLPITRYCPIDFSGYTIDEFVRRRDAGSQIDAPSRVFPGLERITFDSSESLARLADRFLTDEPYRRQVLTELRDVVMGKHTYTAVMNDILGFIRNCLVAGAQNGQNPMHHECNQT